MASTNQSAPDPRASAADDQPALEALFRDAYDELCELARSHRRRWRGNQTLNTHALVHELFIKLAGQDPPLRNPSALYAVASRAMRHLLVNYAERQSAHKRGGDMEQVPLAEVGPVSGEAEVASAEEVLALNGALDRLAATNERQRDVVECRFFGGLSVEETAAALDISAATVKRDWRIARAWLQRELRPERIG